MDPGQRKDRTWLYVGVAFAVSWGVYLAAFNPARGPGGLSAPSLRPARGSTLSADYGWALHDLDGKAVTLGDYRGRPILLNIWATWCPPCRAEMPSLVRLAADPRLRGVAFLGVTGEPPSDRVKTYAQSDMKGLTVLRADGVPAVFATDGIPATFLIDASGKVVASEVGAARWDDPTVVDFLVRLASGR